MHTKMAQTEGVRGSRQYGQLVPISELPCSALGARVDLEAMRGEAGFMMPTDTFSGRASFTVGEEVFELVEAHGETHDQLFVWLPRQKLLMPGDNYYRAFPNLYTIRGTTPRPIRSWIQSLDDMRKLEPEFLVPSHTEPLIGKELVAEQLTAYRDGITWVYVETIRVRPPVLPAPAPAVSVSTPDPTDSHPTDIRSISLRHAHIHQGANEGKSMDEIASTVGLPAHLRDNDALDELYGQIDWCVRNAGCTACSA